MSMRRVVPEGGPDDESLFETPADLCCPITLQLFRDPVINALGQVYERSAIESHFSSVRGTDPTDPITNASLASQQLIPVYTLKSRSYEFRLRVAKACVEKACSLRSSASAVRHLRRAAELVAGMGPHMRVPGLCSELVNYLAAHPSNVYDFTALNLFAEGLRQAGYADQATSVYLRLVEFAEDRTQQATALQRCLACFGHDEQGHYDKAAIPRLAQFIEQQQTFTAGQLVELMCEARLNDMLVVQLCEYLLARHVSASSLTSSSSSSGLAADAGRGTSAGLGPGSSSGGAEPSAKFKDLMLQYTQLRFRLLQGKVDALEQRAVQQPPTHKQHTPQPAHAQPTQNPPAGPHSTRPPGPHKGVRGQGLLPKLRQAVACRHRLLASGLFAALSLLDARKPVVRAVQAAGVLLLVNVHKAR